MQRYNVVARVTAFLDEVVFKEGQEVKEGDVLYRLEQSRFEAMWRLSRGRSRSTGRSKSRRR